MAERPPIVSEPLSAPAASLPYQTTVELKEQYPVELATELTKQMEEQKAPENLPDEWVEAKDPSGRSYYFNSASGVTTWERPTPTILPEEEKPVAEPVGSVVEEKETTDLYLPCFSGGSQLATLAFMQCHCTTIAI